MIRFLLRRILHAGILVFVTLTATFFIIRLAPGDPLTRYYDPEIDPQVMETVRHQLGLDEPLPVQYVKTISSFARGDFGVSLLSHRPVSQMLRETIPRTIQLTGLALLLQVLLGVGMGMISVIKRYSLVDRAFSLVFLIFYSIPSFYLAFLMIILFSLKLQWFPSSGMLSMELRAGSMLEIFLDRAQHLVLPVAVLALGSAAAFARYTRGSVLDVASKEFVRTARAKGLSENVVMWRHVFKNALPQIFTVIGLSIPFLLGGAVIVEKIFAWPGMGSLMVDSIYARDYPVVLAVNFVAAVMVILGNTLADLSYPVVDPRIKLNSRTQPGSRS